MTEEIRTLDATASPDPLRGIVRFERRVKASGPNSSATLSASLPFPVSEQDSFEVIEENLRNASRSVQALVLEGLGLPFTVNPETGVVEESTTYSELMTARVDTQNNEVPSLPERPAHIDAELWADLQNNPDGWFDNRAKKASGEHKANAADFKRRSDSKSIWLKPYTGGRK